MISNTNDECIICLTVPTQRGQLDSCDHLYCFNCIEKWIVVESKCPACKKEIKKIVEVDWITKGSNKKRKHAGKEIQVQKKKQAVHYQQGAGAAGPLNDLDDFQWQYFHDFHPMQVGGPGVRRGGGHRAAAAGGGGGGAYPIQDLMNQVYGGMNRAAARDERSHRHAGIDRPRSIAAAAAGRSAAAATSSSRSRSSRPGNNIMILLCLSTRMYPTSLRRLCIYSTNSPLVPPISSTIDHELA